MASNEPALPWAAHPLPLGTYVDFEVDGGWVFAEVAAAHGEHQYTLLVHPPDEDGGPVGQPGADTAACATAAAADGHKAASVEPLELRVRILSDSLLVVLDSDGGEPADGSAQCRWRPAARNFHEMCTRAILDMAQRRPLPRGVELPSAEDMGAFMANALQEVIRRATSRAAESGSGVVNVESVHAALAGVAADLGLRHVEPLVGQEVQQQEEEQPPQHQQQKNKGEGEGADEQPPEKWARKSR